VRRPNVVLAEKRSAPRLPTALTCRVTIQGTESAGHVVSCSVAGALLALGFEVQPGTSLAISLNLPWLKKEISIQGQAVRSFQDDSYPQVPYRCAVEFDAMTPESTLLMNLAATRDKLGVRRFP
jgi:hypothetical protein